MQGQRMLMAHHRVCVHQLLCW